MRRGAWSEEVSAAAMTADAMQRAPIRRRASREVFMVCCRVGVLVVLAL